MHLNIQIKTTVNSKLYQIELKIFYLYSFGSLCICVQVTKMNLNLILL